MSTGESIVYLVIVTAWVCGIAVAKGFWLTLGCVTFAPMAWVVLAQHLMRLAS
jgi:uncharacterized membrane protein